ncbi:hypothetical protein GOODEAATRI_017383 [Goodea atripinnis]|uniref:Uncharacterized protein n=1 Tax=Goodea atripinnis TaxID=208336 RepID=A0ABV0NEM7_9TELE
MSEDSDPKLYRFSTLGGFQAKEEQGALRGSLSQLRRMASSYSEGCGRQDGGELEPELGLASEGSDSSHEHPASLGSSHGDRKHQRTRLHEDVEMGGSGSSGSGTESHGNESHGNESHGNESVGSSNGNGKDSALMESSGSNKSFNAFSLVSSEQDNPSTSGCSEQSAKAKTQKELFKTLKELKMHLPSEKRSKGKSNTVNTLKYALRCIKQVKANEEYYQMLMINDSQPPGFDVSSYTIEEINTITSEYTLKNTVSMTADIFAVAVSLITGKIVYISDQAASILNCKREVFSNAKFVEFLTPQDVSVFYSFTTPYRLPSWSMCTGAGFLQTNVFLPPHTLLTVCSRMSMRGGWTGTSSMNGRFNDVCAGQPFDHSSIRFCARNGEYITIDTSWSSFVNPWSRKVSFVIGRHKPVHNIGSSGYGSYGSNGSHEQQVSISSSSESNGNVPAGSTTEETGKTKPSRTFQEICKGVHMLKNQDTQVCMRSSLMWQPKAEQRKTSDTQRSSGVLVRDSAPPSQVRDNTGASMDDFTYKDQTVCSYQQISCLDSVIRYLESCNVPITVKRKYQFSSNTTSSNSDDDKRGSEDATAAPSFMWETRSLNRSLEKEAYKRLGLTKEVLAAHTLKEEQAFLSRCRELRNARSFQKECSSCLLNQRGPANAEDSPGQQPVAKQGPTRPETTAKKGNRNRKSKKPRIKHPDSSDSAVSNRKPRPRLQGLNQTSWSTSEASQSAFNVSYPTVVPAYPLYPPTPAVPAQVSRADASLSSAYGEGQNAQAPSTSTPFPAPIVTPMVALVLPNYLFPQMGQVNQVGQLGTAPRPTFFTEQTPPQPPYSTQQAFQTPQAANPMQTQPSFTPQQPFPVQTTFSPQQPFQAAQAPYITQQPFQAAQAPYITQQPFPAPQTAYTTQQRFAAQSSFPVQTPFVAQAPYPAQPFPYTIAPEHAKAPTTEPREEPASRSSTPASGPREPTPSPPLFGSRCSSPLQLNLLSMEEGQRSVERQDSTAVPPGGQGSGAAVGPGAAGDKSGGAAKTDNHQQCKNISYTFFTSLSPSLLPLGSSNTSKYFGSIDSLEHDPKVKGKMRSEGGSEGNKSQPKVSVQGEGEHFIKYVLQEPLWLLMANADDEECLYCEDAAAAPIEEDLPDMDMGELGEDLGREGQSKEPKPQPDPGWGQ